MFYSEIPTHKGVNSYKIKVTKNTENQSTLDLLYGFICPASVLKLLLSLLLRLLLTKIANMIILTLCDTIATLNPCFLRNIRVCKGKSLQGK